MLKIKTLLIYDQIMIECCNLFNFLYHLRKPFVLLFHNLQNTLVRIAACLECRSKLLHSVSSQEELTLQDVKKLDTGRHFFI